MEEFQKRFGKHLKELRGTRTQEQVAEKAGLTKQYISTVERGLSKPCLDTLKKIADALGLTVSDLFRFEYEAKNIEELKYKILLAVQETDNNITAESLYTKVLNIFIHNREDSRIYNE